LRRVFGWNALTRFAFHGALISASASSIGWDEMEMKPSKGLYISTTKVMAPASDAAQTRRAVTASALKGAKSPKLTNKRKSQTMRIKIKGWGT